MRAGDDFDALLAGADAQPPGPAGGPRPGRPLLIASIASVLVGVVALSAAVLLGAGPGGPGRAVAPSFQATEVAATPEPEPDEAPVHSRPAGIAGLADAVWIDAVARETRIPQRALQAYAGAALRAGQDHPGCGLGWNTLAGIGHVESEHGTIGGSHLAADGVATPAIVGIALDGTRSQAIGDSDGGALDGDATWDRAVGPMQFIPTTWAQWGADGDGDGRIDPQNIDDSALAAARYLCEIGGDLTQPDRWIAAVAAYNHTVEYNNRVAEAASAYAQHG